MVEPTAHFIWVKDFDPFEPLLSDEKLQKILEDFEKYGILPEGFRKPMAKTFHRFEKLSSEELRKIHETKDRME